MINVRAFGGSQRCPLTLAREAISVALLMEAHALKLFGRGARPSGILKFKRKLDDATLARLQSRGHAGHSMSTLSGNDVAMDTEGDRARVLIRERIKRVGRP